MVAHVTPTAIIGIGGWGAAVARRAGDLLKERSPGLVVACPVLTLDGADEQAPDQIRQLLRSIRRADLMKRLQHEGLLALDPLVGPPTQVCLVTALEVEQDLLLLREIGDLAAQALAELRVTVSIAAVAWLQSSRPLSLEAVPFPLYVTEPVTRLGLLLDQTEYDEAVAEVVVASVQPGCGGLLHTGRPGVCTVGIAWIDQGLEQFVPWLATEAIRHVAEALGRGGSGTPATDAAPWSHERRLVALTGSSPFGIVEGRLVWEGRAGEEPSSTWERLVMADGESQAALESDKLREAVEALARSHGIPTAIAWLDRLSSDRRQKVEFTPVPRRPTTWSRILQAVRGGERWRDRLEAEATVVIARQMEVLDARLHQACAQWTNRLREVVDHLTMSPGSQEHGWVLHRPMIQMARLQELAAETARRLMADLNRLWPPSRLTDAAEAEARTVLGEVHPSCLAQGEAADRWLEQTATDLMLWSHPLLARVPDLPEGRSFLIWPTGLPAPPMPEGIELIPHALSSAALLTVVNRVSPDLWPRPRVPR